MIYQVTCYYNKQKKDHPLLSFFRVLPDALDDVSECLSTSVPECRRHVPDYIEMIITYYESAGNVSLRIDNCSGM